MKRQSRVRKSVRKAADPPPATQNQPTVDDEVVPVSEAASSTGVRRSSRAPKPNAKYNDYFERKVKERKAEEASPIASNGVDYEDYVKDLKTERRHSSEGEEVSLSDEQVINSTGLLAHSEEPQHEQVQIEWDEEDDILTDVGTSDSTEDLFQLTNHLKLPSLSPDKNESSENEVDDIESDQSDVEESLNKHESLEPPNDKQKIQVEIQESVPDAAMIERTGQIDGSGSEGNDKQPHVNKVTFESADKQPDNQLEEIMERDHSAEINNPPLFLQTSVPDDNGSKENTRRLTRSSVKKDKCLSDLTTRVTRSRNKMTLDTETELAPDCKRGVKNKGVELDTKNQQKKKRRVQKEVSRAIKPVPAFAPASAKYKTHVQFDKKGRFLYTSKQIQQLYADQCYLINRLDEGFIHRSNVTFYRYEQRENCLRLFYPCHDQYGNYYTTTPTRWYIRLGEITPEFLYSRFQPLPVPVVKEVVKVESTEYRPAMIETFIQNPVYERKFYRRVVKVMPVLGRTENLRQNFVHLHKLLSSFVLNTYIYSRNAPPELHRIGMVKLVSKSKKLEYIAWNLFNDKIKSVVSAAINVSQSFFSKDVFQWITAFHQMSSVDIKGKSPFKCCNCVQKRTATHVFTFKSADRGFGWVYDAETMLPRDEKDVPPLPKKPVYMCRICAHPTGKLHQLIHWMFKFSRIIFQNILRRVLTWKKWNQQDKNAEDQVEISEKAIIKNEEFKDNWRNIMFLDFQVCVAEV